MKQLIVYTSLSALGTGGHYATLIVLTELAGIAPLWASIAGSLVGLVINYVLHARITFRQPRLRARTATLFTVSAILSLLLNAGIMAVLLAAGLHYLLAQVLATGTGLACNFLLSRHWVFREEA